LGFGQCEAMFANTPTTSTTTSTGSLSIVASTSSIIVGTAMSFTVGNGNGTYSLSVSPTTCGSFVALQFTPSAAGTCTVFATDTSTTPLSGSLVITVTTN
jgi:hypothetical protein